MERLTVGDQMITADLVSAVTYIINPTRQIGHGQSKGALSSPKKIEPRIGAGARFVTLGNSLSLVVDGILPSAFTQV